MSSYKVILPWKVFLSIKKAFILNLNNYRNAHYQVLNNAKKIFEEEILDQVLVLPKFKKIELTYRIFPGSKRKVDLSNVCSVVDKFFCDALVNNKKLIDDDYKHVISVFYGFGAAVEAGEERIEVEIIAI